MTKKIIPFEINLKSSQRAGFTFQPRPQILTNDANSAELNFIITDASSVELTGSSATVLLFMKDGSFFQNTDVTRVNNTFVYTIKPNQAKHKGIAQAQLVIKIGTVENASPLMEFEIVGGLETKPIVERDIQDWTSLTAEAKAFVDQIEGFTLESFVENKMGQELANLEVNYAGRLTGLESADQTITAQLAQTIRLNESNLSLNNFKESDRAIILGLAEGEINAVLGYRNVTPENTTFFRTGKNLFNKNAVMSGYYLRNTDGVPIASSVWFTSEFIKVDASTEYTAKYAYRMAFYDSNKVFISGLELAGAVPRTFTTPVNTAYLRLDVNTANLDAFQLELGASVTDFEDYYNVIPNKSTEKHPFDIKDVPDKAITKDKVGDEIATMIKATNIVPNGDFNSIDGWTATRSSGSVSNNELIFTATQNLGQYYSNIGNIKPNHKYYVGAKIKGDSNLLRLHLFDLTTGSTSLSEDYSGSGEYELVSGIATLTVQQRIRVIDYRSAGFTPVSFKGVIVVDLTEVFGEGNEPTKDVFESIIKKQNKGSTFFANELITNLIDGELLNPQAADSEYVLPLYVSYKNEILNVISKYSGDKDLRVRMQKKGANNLFDFYGLYLINNGGPTTSASPSSGDALFGVGTDFFAPYKINAINNIDGDYVGGTQFTGGNHAYDGGSTGLPTAKTTVLKVFVDGREITDFEGYANYVDVYWKNLIQASNTKKADGSGREVLQENYHLHYDGNKWSVENIIELLEELKWEVYYGLQAQLSAYNGRIFYHNADNRKWNDAAVNSNSVSKDTNKVTLYKADNWLEVEVDLTGLGKKELNKNAEHGAFVSNGKVYFNLVNSGTTILGTGDVFSFKGAYRFFSK